MNRTLYYIEFPSIMWESLKEQGALDDVPEDARRAADNAVRCAWATGHRYRVTGSREVLESILAPLRTLDDEIHDPKIQRTATQYGQRRRQFTRFARQMPLLARRRHVWAQQAPADTA